MKGLFRVASMKGLGLGKMLMNLTNRLHVAYRVGIKQSVCGVSGGVSGGFL